MILKIRPAFTFKCLSLCLFVFITQLSEKVFSSSVLNIPDQVVGYSADFFMEGLRRWPGSEYKTEYAQKMKQRVEKAFHKIIKYSGHSFKNRNPKIVIISDKNNSPNAWSLGPTIYVSVDLMSMMNDRELTAVLAHELAHTENSHFLRRIPTPLGSFVLSWFRQLTGLLDSDPQQLMEDVYLAQEMQADCWASKWLMQMRNQDRCTIR